MKLRDKSRESEESFSHQPMEGETITPADESSVVADESEVQVIRNKSCRSRIDVFGII